MISIYLFIYLLRRYEGIHTFVFIYEIYDDERMNKRTKILLTTKVPSKVFHWYFYIILGYYLYLRIYEGNTKVISHILTFTVYYYHSA